MSFSNSNRRTFRVITVTTRKIIGAPALLTRLERRCSGGNGRRHPLPIRMSFSGLATSAKGYPVARYRCAVCHRTEVWGIGHNGSPRCLAVT
jgi:hypothetical protein